MAEHLPAGALCFFPITHNPPGSREPLQTPLLPGEQSWAWPRPEGEQVATSVAASPGAGGAGCVQRCQLAACGDSASQPLCPETRREASLSPRRCQPHVRGKSSRQPRGARRQPRDGSWQPPGRHPASQPICSPVPGACPWQVGLADGASGCASRQPIGASKQAGEHSQPGLRPAESRPDPREVPAASVTGAGHRARTPKPSLQLTGWQAAQASEPAHAHVPLQLPPACRGGSETIPGRDVLQEGAGFSDQGTGLLTTETLFASPRRAAGPVHAKRTRCQEEHHSSAISRCHLSLTCLR